MLGELRPNQFGTTAGLWHLNGNSTDSSANGNNGTDTAITYSQANGKFGQGAGFNGSSSYISIPASTAYNFTSDMTVSLWVYPTSVTGIHVISHRQSHPNSGWNFYQEDAALKFSTANGTNVASVSNTLLTINVWQHIAVVKSSTSAIFYKNGNVISNASSASHATASLSQTMQIGRDPSGAQFFSGNMEEIHMCPSALTANQIRTMYALGKGLYY